MSQLNTNQFILRMQLHDKQLISTKELMKHVKDARGKITFPGVVGDYNPQTPIDNLTASQFVLQLGDKQLLKDTEIREFFGYKPERDE